MNKFIFFVLIFSFLGVNTQEPKTKNYLPTPAREALFDFMCATVTAAVAILGQKWGTTAKDLALDLKDLPQWKNNDMFQFFLTEQFLIGNCICLGMSIASIGFMVRGIWHTLQIFTNPLPENITEEPISNASLAH